MIAKNLSPQEKSGVPLASLQLRYQLSVAPTARPGTVETSYTGTALDIENGKASFAGRQIQTAHFSRTGLHWSERNHAGLWCGVLRFSPDRLWCLGYMEQGSARYNVMGAIRSLDYELTRANGQINRLQFGYTGGSAWQAPVQFIELDGHDLGRRATLKHSPGVGLQLHIAERPTAAKAVVPWPHDWIGSASMQVDLGSSTATGTLRPAASRPEIWSGKSSPSALSLQDDGGGGSSPGNDVPSAADLATCDLSNSEQCAQGLVLNNLLWAIEQQWINAFFPSTSSTITRPDLSTDPTRMAAIDPDCEWYNVRFAPAYIGLGLSEAKSGGPSTPLTAQQKLNLQYYLNIGIGLEPAYTRQTQAVASLAATMASSKLATYLADKTQDWAQLLYEYLTLPDQLATLINLILQSNGPGMAQLNDYATILTVLDPTGNYAQQFYSTVTGAITFGISLDATPSNDPDLPQWLPAYIDQFVARHYTGKPRPAEPGEQAAYDIAEDMSEGVTILGDAAQLTGAIIAAMKKYSTEPFVYQAGSIKASLQAAHATWTGTGACKSILTILMAGSIYSSIKAILNWNSLDPNQQASTVVTLGAITYQTILQLPDIASAAAWITEGFTTAVLTAYMKINNIGTIMAAFTQLLANPAGSVFLTVTEWLTKQYNAASRTFSSVGTQLGELFKGADALIRSVGAVLSAAALGISIWSLVTDATSGASVTTLVIDSIQVFLGAVIFICAVLEVVPGVDIVTTVIGVAAGLVSGVISFVQFLFEYFAEEEQSPMDAYQENVVIPLANSLPPAPANWTPPFLTA